MLCRYHASLRSQIKTRGHIYVQTTVSGIFFNPEGIQTIYKNFPCTIRPEELLLSPEKTHLPRILLLKISADIPMYMMQLSEHTNTDLTMIL